MANPHFVSCKQIRFWRPHINGTKISSKEHLQAVIDNEYPGLKHNPRFEQLLDVAERHLDLIEKLQGTTHLKHGDITRISCEVGFPWSSVYSFIKDKVRPRLYRLIEVSVSKTNAQSRIEKIYKENNGLRSQKDVQRRLATYYPAEALVKSLDSQRRLIQVKRYFRALKIFYENGGAFLDVARIVGSNDVTVGRWFKGKVRPNLVTLASLIPQEDPGRNYKWLPLNLEVGKGFRPNTFLRVPIIVKDWNQIREVLNQLTAIKNGNMWQWRKRFGTVSKEEAFGYVLGLMVSDAGKQSRTYTSTGIELTLSKTYPWSEQVGEATCYYLGILGIKAMKCENQNPLAEQKTTYKWRSGNSPLLKWIMQSSLGIQPGETTTYNPVRSDWLFKAPESIRLKFLQGLNDGDGFASTKNQYIGNASGANRDFIKKLLETFNINSTISRKFVRITRQESIIRAAQLPFFLHAEGRQTRLENLVEMLLVKARQKRGPIPKDVVTYMIKLQKQGRSLGDIAEAIFSRFNLSYNPPNISGIVKRAIRKRVLGNT